jgi:uncharacterized protein YjbI with pentapeptide repeats
MKLKAPDAAAATARSPVSRFLSVCLAAFLTIIFASAADAQTNVKGLNPAEQWVVAQVTAGETADLRKLFPENEEKRKLRAHFLEDLLTGALPGVKPHRNGVRIMGATIDEPINLTNGQIPCVVWLDHCQFISSVTFSRASCKGLVSFDETVFEGPVNFIAADFAGDFFAKGAQFKNKVIGASFNSTKIGQTAFFDKAVFEGPVDFIAANIAGVIQADGAHFKNKEQSAVFSGMKVGQFAFFIQAVFEGPVDFTLAEIGSNFEANETQFKNKEQGATFHSMKVGHTAFFRKAVFEGPADLSFSDFAVLDLSEAVYAGPLYLEGMSYKEIRAAGLLEVPESHEALLKVASHAAYRADVYRNLEAFFLRQGYRDDADRAFIEGKRRERNEYLQGLPWLGSWLLDFLVGYGRRPWQAAIPCVFFVALGCFLFSPKRMELQKPDDAPRVYNRFWYSLGLFLPFVDLHADKVWKPKPDQTFLRNYMRVHVLMGWILIPIVLAALTGLIK